MNKFNSMTASSLFTGTTEIQASRVETVAADDIRQPWRSVYGFPMTAARLAANQPLILHCREDEVFDLLASLNRLLVQPETLNRVYAMLNELQSQTRQKLIRRLELEQEPISQNESLKLISDVEQALTQPATQTVAERLETLLASPTSGHEIAGLKTMLARLQALVSALAAVKDRGFHVVVQDRRRQPAHPALEARRDEPVQLDDRPTTWQAGLLFPPKYHLTLWAYQIGRSDRGQSAVWN